MNTTSTAQLPKGWRRVAVKDMADSIQYGHTASAIQRQDGPRFLRITDIQDGRVDWNEVPSCDIPKGDVPKYRLAPGDLVFARTGATTGKSFLIGDCPEAVFASYLIRVRVSTDVDSRYLATFFQSPDYWQQIEGGKRGIGQPNVNGQVLGQVQFPLAPPKEQRRIVAEIEKQFTRLEAGVAALRRVQANLKRYRAAVLKAACEGQLVHTEAELQKSAGKGQKAFESGEQLLKRILAERRQHWSGRGQYKEPAAPDTANPPPFPKGWVVASLEQLTSATRPICYGILMPKENVATGVLFVKVKDMKGDKIDLEGLHRTTPEIAAKYARASLKTGDLLLSIRGTYGRVAEVPKELDGGNITQDTARLDVTPLIDHRYVATCVRNPDAQNYFKRVARGVAVKGVNIGDVRPMPIPLPPLAEQTRIVAEVERRLSVVEELESVVSANLQRATRLMSISFFEQPWREEVDRVRS